MPKISTTIIALLSTLAFSTGALAEQNPCGADPCGNPCATKKPVKKQPVKKDPAAKQAPPEKRAEIKPAEPPELFIPKPPAELAAAAKKMKGTWSCKGTSALPDGTDVKTTATMKWKVELDKFWLRGDLTVKFGTGKQKSGGYAMRGYKAVSYRTYSAAAAKWYEHSVDNNGGVGKSWSSGPDETGKATWEGESSMGEQSMKARHYEEPALDKNGKPRKNAVHLWGEHSTDGGKTYVKQYDVICTK